MTFLILVYFIDLGLKIYMCLNNNSTYSYQIFDKTFTLHLCLIGDEIEYVKCVSIFLEVTYGEIRASMAIFPCCFNITIS